MKENAFFHFLMEIDFLYVNLATQPIQIRVDQTQIFYHICEMKQ